MADIPASVRQLFIKAGWRFSPQGHSPTLDANTSSQDVAARVLAEFSGLRVGAVGPGKDLAASDICFYSQPRPEVSVITHPWLSKVGNLSAVGTAHNDHIIVLVGASGEWYAFTDPDEQLYLLGRDMGEAMERILLGINYGTPIAPDT